METNKCEKLYFQRPGALCSGAFILKVYNHLTFVPGFFLLNGSIHECMVISIRPLYLQIKYGCHHLNFKTKEC